MLYHYIILLVCEFGFRHLKQPLKGGSPWSKLIFWCRRSTYLYGVIYLISSSIEEKTCPQLRKKPGQLDTSSAMLGYEYSISISEVFCKFFLSTFSLYVPFVVFCRILYLISYSVSACLHPRDKQTRLK